MGELLLIDHISYAYPHPEGETPTLFDVSFHVAEGEFIAIVGPGGCGKSTLLSMIAGLLLPERGSICINGKDIKFSEKYIGYMLQKGQLPDLQNALKHIMIGPEIQNRLSDNSYIQINKLMNTLGLITFINSQPSEINDNVKQRAAFFQTMLLEPDILLLDEPFSAFDYLTCPEELADIWSTLRNEKKTVILATRNISEAIRMADRVIIFTPRPGTILRELNITLPSVSRMPCADQSNPDFQEFYELIKGQLAQDDESLC